MRQKKQKFTLQNKIDMVGQEYMLLKIIKYVRGSKRNPASFECQCKCGNITKVTPTKWKETKSCGCINKLLRNDLNIDNESALTIKKFFKANLNYSVEEVACMFGVDPSIVESIKNNTCFSIKRRTRPMKPTKMKNPRGPTPEDKLTALNTQA